MHIHLRRIPACVSLFFLTIIVAPAQPAPQNADARVARLDAIVGLTAEQKAKAIDIFQREQEALDGLPSGERFPRSFDIRQKSRAQIRALLSPDQQKTYDRTPQIRGGGLTLPTPQARVDQLDREVGLTAAQKTVALQVFNEEFNSLLALAPEDRPLRGAEYRRAAQDQVRDLLTPDQRTKRDAKQSAATSKAVEERSAMEKALRSSGGVAQRVGQISSVSMRSASTMSGDNQLPHGTGVFEVTGSITSEIFVVSWQRQPASGSVNIQKITTRAGDLVP